MTTAPVPSGEVETPCATCGGKRWVGPEFADEFGASPCPDCGVEAPEAAEIVLHFDVVEAAARAGYEWNHHEAGTTSCPLWDGDTKELAIARAFHRRRAAAVLKAALPALIAQGWTPPGNGGREMSARDEIEIELWDRVIFTRKSPAPRYLTREKQPK